MRGTWTRWFSAFLLALALAACTDSPEERYAQAQTAAADKEEAKFRTYFTRSSIDLLKGMETAGKRSGMYYVKDQTTLLPKGDLENVNVKDNFAVLTFKVRGQKQDVWMYFEDGEWKIDVTSLPDFWAGLDR
ncbi:MAG: hypothetical protein EP329_17705 [Deltaproteobacteria bacterium]|nr:MAG: hypothetical protein EP329_17705 [Deltaproteobacteria bacterium]